MLSRMCFSQQYCQNQHNIQMQESLKIHPIYSIQIHIHSHHIFTFYNTFFIQTLKRYSRGIVVTVVQHDHPLHPISQLPFAIVNATHIVQTSKILHLVCSVATERPIRTMYFKPIFKLCEQLAGVGRILSQQPPNPYYLLLSPYKKYQMYKQNNKFREQFYSRTQYIDPYTDQLNKQHFIYKLDTLSTYLNQVDKSPLTILCVYALMKSLKIDNRMLYQTLLKNKVFSQCQDDGFKLVTDELGQEIVEVRFMAIVADQQGEKKKEQKPQIGSPPIFENPSLQFLSRLAVPAIFLTLFWKVHSSYSIPML